MIENTYEKILEAKQGNKEAMESLVKNNLGLVYNIAKRFAGRGYEQDDLNQIGAMGLVKSIKKFDTSYNVQLSTFSVPYIIGEIKRYIRDDGSIKVSRSIKELNVKIKELQKEYLNKTGKEITLQELAKELKVSKEEIAMAIDSGTPIDSLENASYRDNKTDKTISLIDKISTNTDEALLISNKITIQQLIKDLEDREKEVIILRYYKEKTQMQVAKILGITQVQVSRIEKKVLNSMKVKLVS